MVFSLMPFSAHIVANVCLNDFCANSNPHSFFNSSFFIFKDGYIDF